MKSLIAALLVLLSFPALSAECNQDDAESKWNMLQTKGIVYDAQMTGGAPTMFVDAPTWNAVSFKAKVGLLAVFDCLIAGPGSHLKQINVLDRGGKKLAVWDGISRELDQN